MSERNRNRGGPEFEIAYYTKELGKPLQRQMLERQLARMAEGNPQRDAASNEPDLPPAQQAPGTAAND